jgi:uncharacterized membrane protein
MNSKAKFIIEEFFFVLFIFSFFIIAVSIYPHLPSIVPIHWNMHGVADGFGSSFIGAFLLPILSLVFYIILMIIPNIAIFRQNIENFEKDYSVFRMVFMSFMLILYVSSLYQIYKPFNMNYVIIPSISLLFIYLGYFMKKTKRNYFIGVKTPWTLSSDFIWDETNKLTGKIFLIYGVISFLFLFYKPYMFYYSLIVFTICLISFIMVFSYILYKKDSNSSHKKRKK